jgi:hypothetical protein
MVMEPRSRPTTEPVHGGCACGAVRFEAALHAPPAASPCACRWCTMTGWWGARVDPEAFRLLAGWEVLRRVDGPVARLRCATCGIDPFAEGEVAGSPYVSLNLRCLDEALPIV